MIRNHVEAFFRTAQERHRIYLRRLGELPSPAGGGWTEDPVFRAWRFCCTFREDDRTTRWFREKLRDPLRDNPEAVLFATVAFRWFNRIETGELLLPMLLAGPAAWDEHEARRLLKDRSPVVTGAYIIKTPNGKSKLDGVLWCINKVWVDAAHLAANLGHTPPDERLMQGVHEVLTGYPYLGNFMAYQVISDLRHTCWLDEAADANTWCAPGPGSARGLGWLVGDDPSMFSHTSKPSIAKMLPLMQELGVESLDNNLWPRSFGRPWEMQTVQHWLCEYDKYTRASKGQDQKRRFS